MDEPLVFQLSCQGAMGVGAGVAEDEEADDDEEVYYGGGVAFYVEDKIL